MVVLTKHLYALDEVKINLLLSLLEKKDFNKVIFWSAEIFHSGFLRELLDYIWQIYYDFYALFSNIKQYKITCKIKNFQKNNNFQEIIKLMYILFQLQAYCEIFIIRNMLKPLKFAKINKFEKVFIIIESLIKEKKINPIYNYLKETLKINETLTIKQYNLMIQRIDKNNTCFKRNNMYSQTLPQLLNHLFRTIHIEIKKPTKKRLKKIPTLHFKYYEKLINTENIEITKILHHKRHYELDDLTCVFSLCRDEMSMPLSHIFWYHWEYYCQKTPYWSDKFKEFQVKWDHEKKSALFSQDSELDTFHEKYDYDLDELPYEISYKSIKTFNNKNILDFLYLYFDIINLPLKKNKIDIKKIIKY